MPRPTPNDSDPAMSETAWFERRRRRTTSMADIKARLNSVPLEETEALNRRPAAVGHSRCLPLTLRPHWQWRLALVVHKQVRAKEATYESLEYDFYESNVHLQEQRAMKGDDKQPTSIRVFRWVLTAVCGAATAGWCFTSSIAACMHGRGTLVAHGCLSSCCMAAVLTAAWGACCGAAHSGGGQHRRRDPIPERVQVPADLQQD